MEQLLLKIASVVARQAATAWLRERGKDERRGAPLAELLAKRYPLVRQQRQFRRKLEEIEDQIVERFTPLVDAEFKGLVEHERVAALIAVADSLEEADLSDAVLFQVDLHPVQLARAVRGQVTAVRHSAALSEPGQQFYDLVLDQSCSCLAYLTLELPEFHSRAAVEMLSRLSTLAAQIEVVLDRLPAISVDFATGSDQDEEFRANYLRMVGELYDRLELLGITTVYYEPRMTLTVAYLSLSASLAGHEPGERTDEEPAISDRFAGSDFTQRLQQVDDALGGRLRTLVQGDAGAGKSTLLQWLAVTAAHSGFTGKLAGWNGVVPFLIRLRDFAGQRLPVGDEVLMHANAPSWGVFAEGWVHRIAESGRALFLVDGVDELMENERRKVRDWLRALVTNYPDARVVVTSRPSAITQRWLTHEAFDTVTLEPMTPDSVQVFVNRWHSALLDATKGHDELLPCKREDVASHERSLLAHLDARPPLRALARNPLLCAMISALNLDRRANLPRDRMALYEAALEMLLERRDADHDVPAAKEQHFTVTEKRALLRALAWWLNENGRAEMSQEEALHQLRLKIEAMPNVTKPAEDVLAFLLLRSGVIRQPVIGRIDFVHRTFQEFLAAKEAVDRDSIDMLINNAHSDLWRETVLMACAHASPWQRSRLLNGLLDRAYNRRDAAHRKQLILLSVACLEMAVEVPREVIERVERAASELIPPTDVNDVNVLATMGLQLLSRLPREVSDLPVTTACASIRAAALVNEQESMTVLARYANDQRSEVQSELLACWHYFDAQSYTRTVLAHAPLFDGFLEVRDQAWLPHLRWLRNLRTLDVRVYPDWLDDLSAFHELEGLRRLLARVAGDCHLHPLTHAKSLAYLNLECTGAVPLPGLLGELTGLRQLVLKVREGLADVSFVSTLAKLTRLELDGIAAGTSLEPLFGLERLDTLALRNCATELDPAALASLPQLAKLDLRGYQGTLDLAPLNGRQLQLTLNRAQDVTGLDDTGPTVVKLF